MVRLCSVRSLHSHILSYFRVVEKVTQDERIMLE